MGVVQKMLETGNLFGQRLLVFSDSQVTIGALAKGRSSRPLLNYVCRRAAALRLAFTTRVCWRWVPTHRNHADAPSRNLPWGTMPARPDESVQQPLPEAFRRAGAG